MIPMQDGFLTINPFLGKIYSLCQFGIGEI